MLEEPPKIESEDSTQVQSNGLDVGDTDVDHSEPDPSSGVCHTLRPDAPEFISDFPEGEPNQLELVSDHTELVDSGVDEALVMTSLLNPATLLRCKVHIGDHGGCTAFVDMGAHINLVRESFIRALNFPVDTRKVLQIRGIGPDNIVSSKGQVELMIRIHGIELKSDNFQVIDDVVVEII